MTSTVISEPPTFRMTSYLRTWSPAQSKAVAEPGKGGLPVTITSFNTGGISTRKTSQKFTLRPGWRRQSLTHARMPTPTMPGPQTQATSLFLLNPASGEHFCLHLGRYLWRCWCDAWSGICFSCRLKLFEIDDGFDFIFSLWLAVELESSGWCLFVCVHRLFHEFLWINQKKGKKRNKIQKKRVGGDWFFKFDIMSFLLFPYSLFFFFPSSQQYTGDSFLKPITK